MDAPRISTPPTPASTVEAWCQALILTEELPAKVRPGPPPRLRDDASWELSPPPRRLERPGRPPSLTVVTQSLRTPKGLQEASARARLLHTFAHHELQAAELFAWAVLAFPHTPRSFRAGLVRLCLEELGHLRLYLRHLETLGAQFGDFPVRDWFWTRVPNCATPASFVALQGLGLEGANLEHSARFAARFRSAGDEAGAAILERVERDEVQHVAFAAQWFERLTGTPLTYEGFRAALPAPLTPAVLQGRTLNRAARRRAGLSETFMDQLAAATLARTVP